MFTPTTFPSAAYDPVERDRIESGRPSSRIEVFQQHQRMTRHDAIAMSVTGGEADAGDERSALHIVPTAIDSIRRSISRVLTNVGHRIDPEAA